VRAPAGARVTLACLAETILLALEDERRDCGVGDNVPLAEVDRVMALARRHGFRLDGSAPIRNGADQRVTLPLSVGREPDARVSNLL
jgi:hypothetical protein